MNVGRSIYEGHGRSGRYLLILFATLGVFSSIAVVSFVLGIVALAIPAMLFSAIVMYIGSRYSSSMPKADIRQVYVLAMANLVVFLLVILALR